MKPQCNSKRNGLSRKTNIFFIFLSEPLSLLLRCGLICTLPPRHCWAGPGWARAGGRAGLGQGGQPTVRWRLSVSWACSPAGLVERLVGRLPGLGRGWQPVGGVGMQAALATVSELVRAGLGRLVCRLGWANGWSVAGGPAACHGAALPVANTSGTGQGCSALVVAGRCELGWASWLVSSAGQFPRPTTEEPPLPWR